jgi:hypothetical protein
MQVSAYIIWRDVRFHNTNKTTIDLLSIIFEEDAQKLLAFVVR